jgi:glycosyl transferase family 87
VSPELVASRPRLSSVVRRPSSATWLALTPFLWSLTLVALFIQFVVYLAHAATILPYPFDIDQGEGYDINAGWLLAQGRPIYTDNQSFPYFSSNYPPVYSLAVAVAIGAWGPTPLAGRAVSFIATLALAALIFLAARARSNGVGGLVAVGCFWLSNYVFHVTPLARVNALTALLALAGLLCLSRQRPAWLALCGGLLLAAVYTKPTAVDAVAAGLVYLWLRRPRLGLIVGGALALGGLALAAMLDLTTQRAFSLNVVAGNVNPFIPTQLVDYFLNFAVLHAVPLALALFVVARAVRCRHLDQLHLFLLAGLAMAVGVGKWGAGESYFLSAIVASAVLAGETAGRLVARQSKLAAPIALLLLAQSAVSAHGALSAWLPGLSDRGLQASSLAREPTRADLERGHGIVTRLRAMPGPGLVEDPSFELAAGKQVVGNSTHLRNLHQAGLWQPDHLVADVTAKRYHTVVLNAELYPEPVLAAIGRHYFLFETVDVYGARQQVFVPGAS